MQPLQSPLPVCGSQLADGRLEPHLLALEEASARLVQCDGLYNRGSEASPCCISRVAIHTRV